MSDRTGQWGQGSDPTVPTAAVGGGEPPTEVHEVVTGGDEPPGRGGTWWIALILILLVMIAALAALLLLLDDDGDDDSTPSTESPATSTPPEETTTAPPTSAETTTTAAPTTTETTAATTTAPAGPSIDSLEASELSCPDPLTLTWTSTGATSVEVAIDTPTGVYDTGPPDGSMEVPAPCDGDTQTYYVTAINDLGERSTEVLELS